VNSLSRIPPSLAEPPLRRKPALLLRLYEFLRRAGKTIASGGGTTFKLPLVGGAAMAAWSSSGTTVYGHSDWQGSIRLNSTPSRTVNSDAVFAPFGEVYNSPTTSWYKYAGLGSYLTSNLWDADYRHYQADQGRWLSPDPAGLAAVDPSNPQSWNRYSYVTNNPMNYIDPLGLREDMPGQCPQVSIDGNPVYDDLGGCAVGGWLVRAILSMDAGALCPDGNCNLIRQGPDGNWQIYVQQDDPSLCATSAWICVGATGQWTSVNLNSLSSGGGGTFLGWTWDDWGVFGRTFLNGVVHGVRQPGQSFSACWDQNVRETTGGTVDPSKLTNQAIVLAQATAATLASISPSGALAGATGATSGVTINGLDMAAWGLGGAAARLFGARALAAPVAFGARVVGYAAAITGAASAGLATGSAINCIRR
jgi:RHS repeat-associated protein